MAREAVVTTWSDLPLPAKAFRVAHAAWALASLSSLGYVWLSAVRRKRDRLLTASVAFLSLEGVALMIGRGDCPFGPLQARLGDPVPLFEVVLPPRSAKAAIPVLTLVTLTGMAALEHRTRATYGPSARRIASSVSHRVLRGSLARSVR